MTGPALRSLQGGKALRSFALDGGALVVRRPDAGDRPAVTRIKAECAALASFNANNFDFTDMARQSGVAIGYGRVTIRDARLSRSGSAPVITESNGGGRSPVLPQQTPYGDRLAWIAVFEWAAPASCPAVSAPVRTPGSGGATTSTTTAPARPRRTSRDYQVFLLDAVTGSGALVYSEGRPPPCGGRGWVAPSVAVPVEQYSVPWRLVSRQPHGYSATIRAEVAACEGYDAQVLAPSDSDTVAVATLGPVDAHCGPVSSVAMTLDAATVTSDLPPRLTHAPLGPLLTLPTPARGPRMPSTGSLRSLSQSQNGSTVVVSVGSVLVPPPLIERNNERNPTTSSDPAVLGRLGADQREPVAEFRAWRPGRAILTQPDCNAGAAGRPSICTKRWKVSVVVRAARR